MPEEVAVLDSDTIRKAGIGARREHGTDLNGLCDEVNELIGELLIDEGLPHSREAYELRHVRVGPDGEERHYVCAIPGKFIADAPDDADVYVDAALTQFSEAARERGRVDASVGPREEIPEVVIAPPGDEWRDAYSDPAEVNGGRQTPNALTTRHLERAAEAFERILGGEDTEEKLDVSARIGVTIEPTDTAHDEAYVVVYIDGELIEGSACPASPADGDDPLQAVHDDLADATPQGAELEWNGLFGAEHVRYRGRVSRH